MRAITLHQPWAEAVALSAEQLLGDWGKRAENRDWCPPASLIGQEIAIHAGKATIDDEDAIAVGKMLFNGLPDERRVKLVKDSYTRGQWYARLIEGMGKILCVATLAGVARSKAELSPQQQRWWIGDYAWKLDRIRVLTHPVLVRGQQGLWEVPPMELAEIRKQVPV